MNLHNINIQNLYGAESLVSALYLYLLPKDKECCANEDSNLHNVKSMVRRFRVIKMIITISTLLDEIRMHLHSLFLWLIKGSFMLFGVSNNDKP